ncbi:MAG TPA: T9SS type A sorting domain-containing protein, partial [Flavobacteriales bacterium]|nr:T9SS type A sorting domain-containing protein [Flavobacteriales bacterium]
CDLPGNSFRPKSGFVDLEMAGSDEEGTFVSRSLALYPNPASGSISVLCPELGNGGSGHVRFFDTTGKLALAGRIQAKLSVLDISKLNGLYTVVVDTQDARHVDRVVIE